MSAVSVRLTSVYGDCLEVCDDRFSDGTGTVVGVGGVAGRWWGVAGGKPRSLLHPTGRGRGGLVTEPLVAGLGGGRADPAVFHRETALPRSLATGVALCPVALVRCLAG